jgi:hypothetical protein
MMGSWAFTWASAEHSSISLNDIMQENKFNPELITEKLKSLTRMHQFN